MRRKKERSKQGQANKQGKATQHTQGSHFFLRKNELPRVGLKPTTLHTLDRALYQHVHVYQGARGFYHLTTVTRCHNYVKVFLARKLPSQLQSDAYGKWWAVHVVFLIGIGFITCSINHNYSKIENDIPCPSISLNFIKIAARILKAATV